MPKLLISMNSLVVAEGDKWGKMFDDSMRAQLLRQVTLLSPDWKQRGTKKKKRNTDRERHRLWSLIIFLAFSFLCLCAAVWRGGEYWQLCAGPSLWERHSHADKQMRKRKRDKGERKKRERKDTVIGGQTLCGCIEIQEMQRQVGWRRKGGRRNVKGEKRRKKVEE